jgi:Plasmid pRiA4b ORF-3-like protein
VRLDEEKVKESNGFEFSGRTGKRACPPEDCGGVWGYASFLEALHDPEHPEHEEMLEWIGGEFDPEAFDLDEVNVELQRLTSSEVRRRPR